MATPQQVQSGSACLQYLSDKLAAAIYLLNTNNLTAEQIQVASKCYEYIEDKLAAIIYLLNTNGDSIQTIQTNAKCYEFLCDYKSAFAYSLNDNNLTPEQIEAGDKCLQYLCDKLACIIYLLNTNNLTPQQIVTNSKCYSYLENKWAVIVGVANSSAPPTPNGLLNDLAAYWTMNEPDGFRLDSTANGNNLSDTQDNVGSAAGLLGLAAQSPAEQTDRQLFSGVISGTGPGNQCSLSVWMNLQAADFPDFIFQIKGNLESNIFYAFTQGSFLKFANDAGQYVFSPVYDYFGWHNFVMVQNSTTLKIYLDGVFIADIGDSIADEFIARVSFFNDIDDSSLSPQALIQQTGIWNKALTQTDVTNLYNGGTPLPFSSFTN